MSDHFDENGWPTNVARRSAALPVNPLAPLYDFGLRIAAIWGDRGRVFLAREDGVRYVSDDNGVHFAEFIGPVPEGMACLNL